MTDEMAITDPILDQADTLDALVFHAIGAGSACWEHLDRAGVFDSERAKQIGDELLARLQPFLREDAVAMSQADPEAFGLYVPTN